MALTVYNQMSANIADGSQVANNLSGRQGEQLNANIHGDWYNANMRKGLYTFNVTAVTVPVIASAMASVFSLWNPTSSGTIAEIVSIQSAQVLATTVVDTLGVYFSSGSKALAGTFTTPAVAGTNYFSSRIGDTPNGQVVPYTAYTHSGTPVRCDIVSDYGATTDAGFWIAEKQYNGRLILPPGVVISLAMSTAAGTASGTDLQVTWAEWPFA